MSALRPVVVVDDDIDHALIVRLVLAQVAPDAEIQIMTDPRALAQRLMDAPRGALVLMDRNLDGRDGIDLLPLLRSERPDVRTVRCPLRCRRRTAHARWRPGRTRRSKSPRPWPRGGMWLRRWLPLRPPRMFGQPDHPRSRRILSQERGPVAQRPRAVGS